jgi:predicted ATPase/DNA-binding SARP family transcriptional activator
MAAAGIRVLGPVEVVGDEGSVALPAKHRRLLAVLALANGRSVDSDRLVDAVWGEAPPASARKLVQVYVSQLRKLLPAAISIVTQPGAYGLALPAGAIDAQRFERHVEDGVEARRAGNPALAVSLVDQGLSLWRGSAYGDLAGEDAFRGEAERLEELRLVALEERIEAKLALGRHADVLGDVMSLAGEHAYRERLHEFVMLALYRCGRQSDALEHFKTVRTRFRGELGLEPGPALRRLQRRILEQDPGLDLVASAPGAERTLPASPNPLVGRARELVALVAMLDRRDARLFVLSGAGGSGKTRLALEAARTAAGSYANGAVLVELAPLRDPALVPATILHAVAGQDVGDRDPLDALVAAVAPLELLLVLDNAEHLRQAAPLLVELVARAPRLTLLVTSRAVLHVSGEHVFPVAPLGEDDAAELFVQRVRAADPSFVREEAQEEDIREIVRRVDGLPLAVELAAARVRALSLRVLRERLDSRLGLLTGGPRDLPSRQQTLRETIKWSVDLLGERERWVLARLAVFPGGAGLEVAESVCDADVDALAALVDEHLAFREELGGEPRFGMLETIREYALDLLGDERLEVEYRLATYLAELVERAELRGPRSAFWLPVLDAEVDNLRAAIDGAIAYGDVALQLRLVAGLWRYWWIRGALAEGLGRLEGALERSHGVLSVTRAAALGGAAGLAWAAGDLDRAVELADEAVSTAEATGGLSEAQAAHTVLGIVANDRGDRSAARRHHARSLELALQRGTEPLVEKLNLGLVVLDEGDHEEAIRLFQDVLAAHRRNGTDEGIGFALLNLGLAHHRLQDRVAARASFEEARDAFERIGFRHQVARALQGLAGVEAAEGRHREAAALAGRAAWELEQVGGRIDEFAPDVLRDVETAGRAALGDVAFDAAFAAGRDGT